MTDLIARISGQAGQGKPVALLDVDRVQLDELLNLGDGETITFSQVWFMPDANIGVIGKQLHYDILSKLPVGSTPFRLVYFTIDGNRYYVNFEKWHFGRLVKWQIGNLVNW